MLKVLFTAAVLLSACVPGAYGSFGSWSGGTTTTTTVSASTSVYINGVELTHAQEAEFEAIFGQIPPGRYHVTEAGYMGIEGQATTVDLKPIIAAYQARHGNRGNGGGGGRTRGTAVLDGRGGGVTFDGNCTIASAPDGTTFSSGC